MEIAAAGGHNVLMVGLPGVGKSMLAARLAGLLPALSAAEALQVTMLHSVARQVVDGGLLQARPFCEPHLSASIAALVGGDESLSVWISWRSVSRLWQRASLWTQICSVGIWPDD